MRIKYLWLLPLFAAFAACDGGSGKFTVIGDVAGMPESDVYLEEVGIENLVMVDSAHVGADGKFEFSGVTPEARLYRLRFPAGRYILLSIKEGNVKVTANWEDIENYTVSGSEGSESLKKLLLIVRGHMRDLSEMQVVIDTLSANGDQEKLASAMASVKEMNISLTRYIEQYADTTAHLPNAIFAAQILNAQAESPFLETFVQSLPSRFPDSKLATDFTAKYSEMMAAINQQKQAAPEMSVGAQAPEIKLQTPDGKMVTLSSFRGKYVLIDFWASWCGPCRQENPNVVKAYNTFKNKNFTILGVSLDDDKDRWVQAIKKDNLAWTHISDLKGWQSMAARDYAVNAIPANFLVDPDGIIIASNLRGQDLSAKLAQVLNSPAQ